MKNPTVTIGIATSFAGENLLETARGILASVGNAPNRRVIYADTTPLTSELKRKLRALGFSIHWTSGPGSFFSKVRRMIKETHSDFLIVTQDDVIFDRKTVSAVVDAFDKHPKATMVGIRIFPLAPDSRFEQAMTSMLRIVDSIAGKWNHGDNYLAASGRCLAFRTSFIKKIPIPEVVNGDMYLYLANMRSGGLFIRADTAIVYIRVPQTFKDQIRPSSRYQYSQAEMEKYFVTNLSAQYRIPPSVLFWSVLEECIRHPLLVMHYVLIRILTRLMRKPSSSILSPVWSADTSTKNI